MGRKKGKGKRQGQGIYTINSLINFFIFYFSCFNTFVVSREKEDFWHIQNIFFTCIACMVISSAKLHPHKPLNIAPIMSFILHIFLSLYHRSFSHSNFSSPNFIDQRDKTKSYSFLIRWVFLL